MGPKKKHRPEYSPSQKKAKRIKEKDGQLYAVITGEPVPSFPPWPAPSEEGGGVVIPCQCVGVILLIKYVICCHGYNWSSINLPAIHVPFFFTNNPEIEKICRHDRDCPYKEAVGRNVCWGYENECPQENWRIKPHCPDGSGGWTQSKDKQIDIFWTGSDFGCVAEERSEIKTLCAPLHEHDSKLECSTKTRFCRAKHLYLDLRGNKFNDDEMYHKDFLHEGEIGGHCKLDKDALTEQLTVTEPHLREDGQLHSWILQMKTYTSLSFQPVERDLNCDTTISKPTMLLKYMSLTNMFHHFRDFINLYTSQLMNNSFSTDVQIVIWDESPFIYEEDLFKETFRAFTQHPVMFLGELRGKRVCFKDVIFVPPRMINGMIPNMSMIPGCYMSSLIKAFSEHILHRLGVPEEKPSGNQVRVTFLSRNTQYRNTINKHELFAALEEMDSVEAMFAEFDSDKISFLDQLQISRNSDVFIGIHGAGLTHVLFQPDWGVVIELHNSSSSCYNNLARLRGLRYLTFDRKEYYSPKIKCTDKPSDTSTQYQCEDNSPGGRERQSDFSFDKQAFITLVNQAIGYVQSHPEYHQSQRRQTKEEL